jgi:hypothetical protein
MTSNFPRASQYCQSHAIARGVSDAAETSSTRVPLLTSRGQPGSGAIPGMLENAEGSFRGTGNLASDRQSDRYAWHRPGPREDATEFSRMHLILDIDASGE